jgi:superfamily II DNA or RNA helicase
MPTGAGKTRTAMHLVASHLSQHEPTTVVWLAYSSELLEQAAEDFAAAWKSLGDRELPLVRFWGAGALDILAFRDCFIVAGLSKMHSWSQKDLDGFLRLADRTSLTVMDEAHQSTARTYRQLLDGLATKRPDAQLLGLTATPGRTWADIDADRELSDFFRGNKVRLEVEGFQNPVEYLMSEGYLARPVFRRLDVDADLSWTEEDARRLAESVDIPEEALRALATSDARNVGILTEVVNLLQKHDRILVFAIDVAHAELLAAALSAIDVEAYSITGETPRSDRAHRIKRFRSNVARPMVLTNYGVLTTGFDAPNASAAVIARPTKSLVLYSQMVGRVTRGPKAGGNESCEIVTVVDPDLPGFGSVADAFTNWEDVWE